MRSNTTDRCPCTVLRDGSPTRTLTTSHAIDVTCSQGHALWAVGRAMAARGCSGTALGLLRGALG